MQIFFEKIVSCSKNSNVSSAHDELFELFFVQMILPEAVFDSFSTKTFQKFP